MLFVSQLGSACIAVTTTAVSIRNFPEADRGKAAGLAKAYFGLSSAILSQIYHDFYSSEALEFLRCLSLYIPFVLLVALVKVKIICLPPLLHDHQNEKQLPANNLFFICYLHFTGMIIYILITGALGHFMELGSSSKKVIGMGMILLQTSVLLIPCVRLDYVWSLVWFGGLSKAEPFFPLEPEPVQPSPDESTWSPSNCKRTATVPQEEFFESKKSSDNNNSPELQVPESAITLCADLPDLKLLKAAQTLRFWVLFLMFFCGSGSGLIVINNVPQIAKSLHVSPSSFFVSLIGIFNCVGRVLIGWMSDRIKAHLTRPALLCVVVFCMGLNCFVFSSGFSVVLYPCLMSTGFLYGGIFALVVTTASDYFGPAHIAMNYGALDLAPAFASFFFATFIVNVFYIKGCFNCFSGTFLIAGCSCFGSCVVYLVSTWFGKSKCELHQLPKFWRFNIFKVK